MANPRRSGTAIPAHTGQPAGQKPEQAPTWADVLGSALVGAAETHGDTTVVRGFSLSMEWDAAGASVMCSGRMACPVCGVEVTPNVRHLCGDIAQGGAR